MSLYKIIGQLVKFLQDIEHYLKINLSGFNICEFLTKKIFYCDKIN